MKTLKELLKGNSKADQQKLDEYEKFLNLIQSLGGCRQTFKENIENGMNVLDMLDALIPNGLGFVNKQPKYKKIEFCGRVHYMTDESYKCYKEHINFYETQCNETGLIVMSRYSDVVLDKSTDLVYKLQLSLNDVFDKYYGVE